LCEWLWSDLTPERAAAALRSTLHDLRRAVSPELESGDPSSPIVAEGETVRLVLAERDTWDGGEILALSRDPSGGRFAGPALEDGLALIEGLYRGPFLAEWPFDDWAMERRVEIDEAFKGLLARFADALVAAGRPGQAIGRYRRLLQMEPERESWHRNLMRAHAAAGERALALRQYHACRTVLRREQGIEPDAETRALYQALLREA
jgi:DNA-binding SARP family transcriptional activator